MSDREITLEQLHRDHISLASTITSVIEEQRGTRQFIEEMKTDRAVRAERDLNLNERLGRIEESIQSVYGLGKWLLLAIGAAFVTAFVTFIINGGLHVGT